MTLYKREFLGTSTRLKELSKGSKFKSWVQLGYNF
jgi:hypothetical protein